MDTVLINYRVLNVDEEQLKNGEFAKTFFNVSFPKVIFNITFNLLFPRGSERLAETIQSKILIRHMYQDSIPKFKWAKKRLLYDSIVANNKP